MPKACLFPILLLLLPGSAAVLLSSVQAEGQGADDEFVELHNSGPESVDLTGWKLRYQSSSGTWYDRATLRTNIPPGSFYLIAGSAYLGPVEADLRRGLSISASSSGFALALVDSRGEAVDLVGCGTAAALSRKGRLAAVVPSGAALVRKAWSGADGASMAPTGRDFFFGKGHDSGDNSLDWVSCPGFLPKNSRSPAEPSSDPVLLGSEGTTNSRGSWVSIRGRNFLSFLPETCRLAGPDGLALQVDFLEVGAYWSNDCLRFRFPPGLSRKTSVTLERHAPRGERVGVSLPELVVAPPTVASTDPVLDSVKRGQPFEIRGAFFGGPASDLLLCLDGATLPWSEITLWTDDRIAFYLPEEAAIGKSIQLRNPATGDQVDLPIAGLGNGPPLLRPGCLALSRNLAGPGIAVQVSFFRRDGEGDAPLAGFPRLHWGTESGIVLEPFKSNEYRGTFLPARWSLPGVGRVEFRMSDASATGASQPVTSEAVLSTLALDWEAPKAPGVFRWEESISGMIRLLWESGESDLAGYSLRLAIPGEPEREFALEPAIRAFELPDSKPGQAIVARLCAEDRAGNRGPWSTCALPATAGYQALSNTDRTLRHRRGDALRLSSVPAGSELRLLDLGGREFHRRSAALGGEVEIPPEAFPRGGLMFLVSSHPREGRKVFRIWVVP